MIDLVNENGMPIWLRNGHRRRMPEAPITMVNHNLPHQSHNYNLYEVTFNTDTIHTMVTASSSRVDSWLSTVHFPNLHLMVGLDVEWRPNTWPNNRRNPVATLQLCVGHRCMVFQIIHAHSIPHALYSFLADPDVKFFHVGIRADAEKLLEDYNLHVANVCDLRELGEEKLRGPFYPDMRQAGLKTLGRCLLGLEVEKPQW